jgi:hypothetical protein
LAALEWFVGGSNAQKIDCLTVKVTQTSIRDPQTCAGLIGHEYKINRRHRPPVGKGSVRLKQAFLLGPLARQFTGAPHGLGLFTGPAFGRLLKILPHFHFAEDTFALQFLLQGTKRLIDVIVANTDLYQWSSPSKSAEFRRIIAKPQ